MKFLSKKDLFGSQVPKTYINKITLESQGYSQPPKISNPHVVPVDRAKFAKFIGSHGAILRSRGAREATGIDKTESATGIVDSAKELGMKSDPAPLIVTLDLVIKDIVGSVPTFKPQPTREIDIKKYIKVYVAQCTTSDQTDDIKLKAMESGGGGLEHKLSISPVAHQILAKPLADIIDIRVTTENTGDLALFKEMNQRLSVRDIPYRIIFDHDVNGNLLPYQPRYLAYFVWAEFDLTLMADDFDFDTSNIDTSSLLGAMNFRSRLIYDVVISASKITETAFIYVTDDGAIWTGDATNIGNGKWWTGRWLKPGESEIYEGPTHQMPDGRWMTGDIHISSEVPDQSSTYVIRELVNKETVRNTRIQDFRGIERLEKVNLDFSYIENHLTNNILKTSRMLSEFKTGGDSRKYFSNMYLTRDLNNNCRFFFALRKDKILEDFSPLRALYREDKISKGFIQAECPIVSMKFHRVRIKGSPEIGSQTVRRQKPYNFGTVNPLNFNNNNEYEGSYSFTASGSNPNLRTTEESELLFEKLWDGTTSQPVSIDGKSFVGKVSNIFTLTERDAINSAPHDDGVTYFSGVDGTVKDKTDGYYQYKVALEIKDGSADYLFSMYTNLKDVKRRLNEYYQIASQVGEGNDNRVSNIRNLVNNPHIKHEGKKGYSTFANVDEAGNREAIGDVEHEQGSTNPAYFNSALNRFTRDFINHANVTWASDFWESLVTEYVEIIRKVGGIVTRPTQDALTNYIRPQTGNLKGISAVLKLFDNLIGILLRAMKGLRPTYATPADRSPGITLDNKNVLVQSRITGQHPPRLKTVKVEHQFDSIFNANLPLNTGLDVLGLLPMTVNTNTPNITGLRVVSDTEFQFIVESELSKIFKSPTTISIFGWDSNQRYGYPLQDTQYSYFTPTIIKTPIKTINLRDLAGVEQSTQGNQNSNQSAMDGLGWVQATAEFVRNAQTAKTVSYPVYSFMASNYNLTIVPLTNEPQIPIVAPGETNDQIEDTFYPNGENKSFIDRGHEYDKFRQQSTIIFAELLDHISPSKSDDHKGGIALRKPKKDLALYSENIVGSYYSNLLSKQQPCPECRPPRASEMEYWTKLPNAVKALFTLANGGTAGGVLNPGGQTFRGDVLSMFRDGLWGTLAQRAKTRYKFEAIYKLEYFTGWKNITQGSSLIHAGEESLMERDWAPLNTSIYELAKTHQKTLLCRLMEYNNPEMGVEFKEQLPLFEQFFLLRPNSTLSNQIPATTVAVEIEDNLTVAEGITNQDIAQFLRTNNFSDQSRTDVGPTTPNITLYTGGSS